MSENRDYFHIEFEMLKDDHLFPFHLHVFNPSNSKYSPFLYANSPLDEKKREFIEYIIERGGELAIQTNQKRTFLTNRGLEETDVPDLLPKGPHNLELQFEERKKKLELREKIRGPFDLKSEITLAALADNFESLINSARDKLMTLSPHINHTTSLACYLAENLLVEDNFINRIVAVSYHMAMNCNMKDEETIGDLVCAAFFAHIGLTQMDFYLSQKAQLEMYDEEKNTYRKHPGLSHHIIRKSGVDLTERCVRVINQHHERYDGNGYPENTKGSHIEPISLILGASSHIIEYYSGKITGQKTPLQVIVKNLKNKTLTPGLEIEFGDTIYEALSFLISEDVLSENRDIAS